MAKTYRVTVCDVTVALAPIAHVCYIAAAKYDGAWKGARGALNADKRDKPVDGYPAERCTLYVDEACKTPFEHCGDAFTVARIDDMTARNAKVDVKALRDIVASDDDDAETQLAKLKAALGVK